MRLESISGLACDRRRRVPAHRPRWTGPVGRVKVLRMVGPITFRTDDAQLVEWRPGVRTRLHASSAAEPASLCMIEQWCDPGLGAPTHTHFEVEEVIAI